MKRARGGVGGDSSSVSTQLHHVPQPRLGLWLAGLGTLSVFTKFCWAAPEGRSAGNQLGGRDRPSEGCCFQPGSHGGERPVVCMGGAEGRAAGWGAAGGRPSASPATRSSSSQSPWVMVREAYLGSLVPITIFKKAMDTEAQSG